MIIIRAMTRERERESKKPRNNNAKHDSLSMLSNRIRNEKCEKKVFKLIFIFLWPSRIAPFHKAGELWPQKKLIRVTRLPVRLWVFIDFKHIDRKKKIKLVQKENVL